MKKRSSLMTRKKLKPISVSNLELDSAFKKWMGTSPIEIKGVNNRIGYWTLKSWLTIPEERRPEGSDNEVRYKYAQGKFALFERVIRVERRKEKTKKKKKKRKGIGQRDNKIKQLLARKNWGLPREVFEEVGVVIEKVNVTEEDVSFLATEIKQAFKSPKHQFFPAEGVITNFSGLGSAKEIVRLMYTFYSLSREKGGFMSPQEMKEKQDLRESNPEVRTGKKFSFVKNLASMVLIPAISQVFMGLGFVGLWKIFYSFFKKTVHYSTLKGVLGTWTATATGVASFFIAIALVYVIYRLAFQKYVRKSKSDPEKTPSYNTIAAEVVQGYKTPKKIAKEYQSRVNLILKQDIESSVKKERILELWAEFQNDIAPSIDKGEYLRGYQEGASYGDYLKRGSEEGNEGFNFFLNFKDLTQRIELEEEIPVLLEENKEEIMKEMGAIIKGKKKMPKGFLNCVKASLQT